MAGLRAAFATGLRRVPPRRARLGALALLVAGVALVRAAGVEVWPTPQAPTLSGLAALALAVVTGSLLMVPRTVMGVGAGYAFGFWAAPVVLAAAVLGASLAFLAARGLAQDLVREALGRRPGLNALFAAIEDEGWRVVAAVRLGAPVPSSLASYLFGATRIGFRAFAAGTLVGMVPTVALHVAIGASGQTVLSGSSGLELAVLAFGLVAMAATLVLVRRRLGARLRAMRAAPEQPASPAL